jgi:hypothetical protein
MSGEKNKIEMKKMLKELKIGVHHPKDKLKIAN